MGVSRAKQSNCFRCLEKLVVPSSFDTSLYVVGLVELCPTTVLSERMRGRGMPWGSGPQTPMMSGHIRARVYYSTDGLRSCIALMEYNLIAQKYYSIFIRLPRQWEQHQEVYSM